ncbi:LytR/AlgR family response regulator transcription factor, partial [Bacteroidota bacterium]
DFEVIFITAYKQYAINAIKNAAIDYLLKPVNFIDIKEALSRFESKKLEKSRQQRIETLLTNLSSSSDIQDKVALPTMNGYQMIRINHIMYCEADVNYTKIHIVGQKEVLVSKTLKYIEELLPSDIFFRIHKSYLINLNYVNNYVNKNGQYVVMDDGTELDVAFRRADEFVKAITNKANGK